MGLSQIALIFLLFILTVAGCNQPLENTGPPQVVAYDTSAATPPSVRQIDLLKDLSSFRINANYLDMDAYINAFMARPSVKATDVSEVYCQGDACYRYKCLKDTAGDEYLYIVKHDEGEYGFGNEQYFFAGDKMRLVRSFRHELAPKDDKPISFTTTEYICLLDADKSKGYTRSMETDGAYIFDIQSFTETAIDAAEAEENWRDELRQYFTIEIEAKKEEMD